MLTRKFRWAMTLPVLLSITLLTSCDKDDDNDDEQKDNTITGIVVDNQDFSTLESAVVKANLQATLSSAGPFTVFAPDNDAFSSAGINANTLAGLSTEQVSNILLYHTLSSKVSSQDVPAGPNASVTTASGDSVFVTKNAAGVFINGIKVKQADIAASNGVIHRLGGVLLPPSGNIVETAQMEGSGLDSLVKAVVRANNEVGGDPSLVATLQTATLTLFAPTNDAFTSLLDALSINDINEIPIATLVAVLKYHVVAGRAFSSDLANGNIPTVQGGNVSINLTNGTGGGPTVTGSGNAGAGSNIVKTNIMTRNGVVHVIDKVLIP